MDIAKIECSLHKIVAEKICLNTKCNQKRIFCQKCFEEDSQILNCKQQHSDDVCELSQLQEVNLNQFYNSFRQKYLDDANYQYKSVANQNKIKFENLGRDFYYYLQQKSFRGFKRQHEVLSFQEYEDLISFNTSQCRFRKIFQTFTSNLNSYQKEISKQDKDQIDQKLIIEDENRLSNQLSEDLSGFSQNLIKCQGTMANTNYYQESYTDIEIETLQKKLQNVISEFVEKKIKKKQKKKRVAEERITNVESKLQVDVSIPENTEIPQTVEKAEVQEVILQNNEAVPMEIEQIQTIINIQNEIQA